MLTNIEAYQNRLRSHLAIAQHLEFGKKEAAPVFLRRSPLFLLDITGPVYSKLAKYRYPGFFTLSDCENRISKKEKIESEICCTAVPDEQQRLLKRYITF